MNGPEVALICAHIGTSTLDCLGIQEFRVVAPTGRLRLGNFVPECLSSTCRSDMPIGSSRFQMFLLDRLKAAMVHQDLNGDQMA
jgi:hypothetical protein